MLEFCQFEGFPKGLDLLSPETFISVQLICIMALQNITHKCLELFTNFETLCSGIYR